MAAMKRDIRLIISKMTLEEKASLCSGLDFWHTKSVERLGIPSIMMADGPHGLRKQSREENDLGAEKSVPATCFPTGAALACSWDRKLAEEIGAALGRECRSQNVSILLGPACNIKRSPLCGRNFEYLSEDPFLSSELAVSYIKGVQSQGVGTSLKHYAANNQETRRLTIDAVIDERTLREIYLAAFEGAVKQGKPWTVMCSYNKVNGEYCSENKYLLSDILRKEWGFDGFVVSDWGAVNDRVAGLKAGLELEMPASGGEGDKKIVEAAKSGELPESVLDRAVERLLEVIFKAADNMEPPAGGSCKMEEHHALARRAAGECAVLLKNEGAILPLKKKGRLAIIGAFAKHSRYQGGGSSRVNPTMLDNAYDEIVRAAGPEIVVTYSAGYGIDEEYRGIFSKTPFSSVGDTVNADLVKEAVENAGDADVAVIFAGLPDNYESEGFDRKHMRMSEGHNELIEAVAAVQENTVVVLYNGAPVEMPWIRKVRAVLEMNLGGQAAGGAAADLLFGNVNPSGKLAVTFPKKLSDNPSYLNFPGGQKKVEYREGLFVGYRYYDAAEVEPLFPFGFGLSYTRFEYTGISVDKAVIYDNEEVHVSVGVKNIGSVAGKEIVQLYVSDVECGVTRPAKELKGFEKVELQPGEEKTVVFTLGKRAFAYYDTDIGDWRVESGDFRILVGRSSGDIALEAVVRVNSTAVVRKTYSRNSPIGEILGDPAGKALLAPLLKTLKNAGSFGATENGEEEGAKNRAGGIDEVGEPDAQFLEMPLRSLVTFNPHVIAGKEIDELLRKLNENR